MNDYKELINWLRTDAGLSSCPNAMRATADAIEQLVRERDAAVSDLTYLANDPNAPVEKLCKRWTDHGCCCYNEKHEKVENCTGWEWRGCWDERLQGTY